MTLIGSCHFIKIKLMSLLCGFWIPSLIERAKWDGNTLATRWQRAALLHNILLIMKKYYYRSIDLSKVETLVYHLPEGPALSVEMGELDGIFDLDMEIGDICDTSDIDGVMHFFPKGNAWSSPLIYLFISSEPFSSEPFSLWRCHCQINKKQ